MLQRHEVKGQSGLSFLPSPRVGHVVEQFQRRASGLGEWCVHGGLSMRGLWVRIGEPYTNHELAQFSADKVRRECKPVRVRPVAL